MTALLGFLRMAWPFLLSAIVGGSLMGWVAKARVDNAHAETRETRADLAAVTAERDSLQSDWEDCADATETSRKAFDVCQEQAADNMQVIEHLRIRARRAEEARIAIDRDKTALRRELDAAQAAPVTDCGSEPIANEIVEAMPDES